MDLVRFVRLLVKRKLLIISIPLFAMLVSHFLLKHTPDVYKSNAKIATGITDELNISIEDSESKKPHVIANKFSNLIQLTKSRSVIDLLSYKLILHDLLEEKPFRENGKYFNSLSADMQHLITEKFQTKYDSLHMLTSMDKMEKHLVKVLEEKKYDYKNLIEKIKVYRLEMSDFIEVEFESENPYLSSFIVNNLITEFIKYYKYMSSEKSDNSVNFFGNLAAKKKRELDEIVEVLKNYKLKNGIINLYEQTEAVVDHIAKVEIMREKDNKLILSLKEAIKAIDKKLKGRDQLFLEADIRPFNMEISVLKENIKSLNERIIEGNVDEADVADSLKEMKNNLNNKVRALTDEIVVDHNVSMQNLINKKIEYVLQLEIVENSVLSIDKELDRLYKVAEGYAPSEALISSYEREISVAEEVYILMLNKLNTATLNSMNLVGSINQVETGLPAEKPEASKKLLLMILTGIVSFVFTVVIIFILEYLDLTIKSPAEFNLLVNLPLIGVSNRLKANLLDLRTTFSEFNNSIEMNSFKQLIRMIRFEVENRMGNNKTLLVTSTRNSSGKTLYTSSLAYSISITGKRVLMIDANLSNNSLTQQFNVKPTLQSLLKREIDLCEAIQKTKVEQIDIIGCEKSNLSLVEINGNSEIKKMIDLAAQMYDYVLIEGAQLNNYSDSKDMMKYVDNVLVVFSSLNTVSSADNNSIEYLKTQKEKLIGAVLNNVAEEYIESVLGEIKRERTKFRVVVKKYLNRNFSKPVAANQTEINL